MFMLYKISSSSNPWLDQSFLLSTVCPQKVDYIIFSASFGRPPLAFMVVFVHLGQFRATESHLGYLKHFFGIPSAQHVSIWANCYCIYEVCCLLWCRLVAVEIDGHQQWTNDWHTSLRMCLLHTGDTTIFNHLDSQSFVFPKWRISCEDKDETRPKSCRWLLVLSWDCRKCIILFLVQTVDLDFKAALNLSICLENLICLVMFSLHINPMYLHDISVSWYAHINKNNDNSRWFVYSPLSLQIYI